MQPSQAPFLCSETNKYTFCAPTGLGNFYIGIPENQPQQFDISHIQSWFGNQYFTPQPAGQIPNGLDVFQHSRIYDVTNFLPKIVSTRTGTNDDVVGPNCYQAALVAAGFQEFSGRYVDTKEVEYFLHIYFKEKDCGNKENGDLLIYDESKPDENDAGDHMAIRLGKSDLVFQKTCFQRYCDYVITTEDSAMKEVESVWRAHPEDRFNGPAAPWPVYEHKCYERREKPLERSTSSTKADREWFLPFLQYYNMRLGDISKYHGDDFITRRIDLMTIENMWVVSHDFRERVGIIESTHVLMAIDDNIARAYLKLESLSWQYDIMTKTYDPRKYSYQMEDLYKMHYVTFDDNFYAELKLYLKLLNVPEAKWGMVTTKFVEKIKTYNPVSFAQTDQKIPYLDILKEVIAGN